MTNTQDSEASSSVLCRIMIINGSQELLELFAELFEEFGEGRYECTLHALADTHHVNRIRELKPDVILVDQPFSDLEMRGWDLVQNIRLARDLKELPVIFMTTNARLMSELEAQLGSLGVRTLLKPFDPDHLIAQVQDTLAKAGVPLGSPDGAEKINE
jgi:CheY-like chemotaxis protein